MSLEGLDKLVASGQRLLDQHEAKQTHCDFNLWVSEVSHWLTNRFPDSGVSAEWASQSNSNLSMGGQYSDNSADWAIFRLRVEERLRWLGRLPQKLEIAKLSFAFTSQNEAIQSGGKDIELNTTSKAYVDPTRISEIKKISNQNYDLTKLARLCEELNICFAGECYLSIAMLTRSILDHIPPIFGHSSFAEVANNYAAGKSFKQAMQNLEKSSRNISDYYLHSQIRKSESVPNATQINFSNELDFLLAEITRILRE